MPPTPLENAPDGLPASGTGSDRDPPSGGAVRLGSVVLGVVAGTQAMLAAMLVVRRGVDPAVVEQLTLRGRILFQPEYDMALYIAGCLTSLAAARLLAWTTLRRWRHLAGPEADSFPIFCATLQLALAALATAAVAFVLARTPRTPGPISPSRGAALAAPGIIAVLVALVGLRLGPGRLAAPLGRFRKWLTATSNSATDLAEPENGPGLRAVWPSLAVLALIASIVAVPSCRRLAGAFALLDSVPFHHWDFFVMGPALRYLHGAALGTEIYSQYGVGWPVLYAWLSPVLEISYANVLAVSIACGTIYFAGLYLALRLALGRTSWAAAAVILAIAVQMHHGVHPQMTIWLTPSSSVIRAPMDVWFFLALMLHRRTGRAGWSVLAGALAGIGLLFETDTGLYLIATLAVYGASGWWWAAKREKRKAAATGLASLAATAATALGGLAIASRGTLVRREFWEGWLEPLRVYGGGMSAMPVTTASGVSSLLLFLAMAGTYVSVIGLVAGSAKRRQAPGLRSLRRDARAHEAGSQSPFSLSVVGLVASCRLGEGTRIHGDPLFGLCLSAYGLCTLLQFVNRSHEFNLYHACIPFSIIWIVIAATSVRRLAGPARTWLPRAAVVAALVALASSSGFRAYPHIWNRLIEGKPAKSLTLMPGVSGLPRERLGFVVEFRKVVRQMEAVRSSGLTVGVLDPAETMLYLASGCPPLGRYTSLITHVIRKDQLAEAETRLSAARPDYWVVRDAAANDASWGDVRLALAGRVARDYELQGRIGTYQIWRCRETTPSRVAHDDLVGFVRETRYVNQARSR